VSTQPAVEQPGSEKPNILKNIFSSQESTIFLVIIAGGIALTFISPYFFNKDNFLAIFMAASFESIVAIGMTLLLISGGFDLSVGSTFAFSGVVTGVLLANGVGAVWAILIGLAAGGAVGYINGIIISKMKVNPLITTLAMMSIIRGVVFVMTRGLGVSNLPDVFNVIGQTKILGVQTPIIIMIILVILFGLIFKYSVFFRQYFYIGGNEDAALYSGIKVIRLKIIAYVTSGLTAGLAGILTAARMGGALSTAGTGLELRVITACIIGGCSLAGGEGTMWGSFLGVILMVLVANAFNLTGVSPYWQRAIYGFILLAAVLFDAVRRRKMEE
jgi:ribose transport system permease protein